MGTPREIISEAIRLRLALGAPGEDVLVLGAALEAVVVAAVVAVAVAVLFAVGLVVLAVVGHQVGQGEAVVGGDEVQRGEPGPARRFEQAGRAGQGVGEARPPDAALAAGVDGGAVGEPEAAHGVAEMVVPVHPAGGETAGLPAAVADVPGFGDQLDARTATGSAATATRNGCRGSNSFAAFRQSVTARSKRKPSMWNSFTQ